MVPAPGGLPVVGHLAAFHRDRLGFLDACRATGGPVVRLRFARPTYLLLEPDDIGHVLVSYGSYAKTDRLTDGRGQRAVGGGVLVAREGDHRDKRRAVRQRPLGATARALCRARSRAHRPRHRRMAGRRPRRRVTRDGWSRERRDAGRDLRRGGRRGTRDDLRGDRGAPPEPRSKRAFPLPLPRAPPTRAAAAEAPGDRGARRRDRSEARRRSRLGPRRPRVDERLVCRRGARRGGVARRRRLRDRRAGARLVPARRRRGAGGPGTASRGGRPARRCAADGLRPRPAAYATACFEEAMRLRPPSWIVVRDVLREDSLPSGARLAPGARVYASQWVTHRDPRLHPEPERFDPERFLDGGQRGAPSTRTSRSAPGPRDCVGRGSRDARGCARSRTRRPAQSPSSRRHSRRGSTPGWCSALPAGCRWSSAGAETRGLQSARGGRHSRECAVRRSPCS